MRIDIASIVKIGEINSLNQIIQKLRDILIVNQELLSAITQKTQVYHLKI